MTTDASVRGLAEGWLDSSFRGDEWAQPTAGVAIVRGRLWNDLRVQEREADETVGVLRASVASRMTFEFNSERE